MKRFWNEEDLIEHFTISPQEYDLLKGRSSAGKFGFILLLKFMQYEGRFPSSFKEIPKDILKYIETQLNASSDLSKYNWNGREAKNHRVIIREFLGFKKWSRNYTDELTEWLKTNIIAKFFKDTQIKESALSYLHQKKIEPPQPSYLDRIIKSARNSWEEDFFKNISSKLTRSSRNNMDILLHNDIFDDDSISFRDIKSDAGNVSKKSIKKELDKLEVINKIDLPFQLLKGISGKIKKIYYSRVMIEPLREIKRHPEYIRHALLAIFFELRRSEIIDDTIELFIKAVKGIKNNAEEYVNKNIIGEMKKIRGKDKLLFKVVSASRKNPDKTVKKVVFPIIGKDRMDQIIREHEHKGSIYDLKVNERIRVTYRSHHHRSILISIIKNLNFRSNNKAYKDFIKAVGILKKYADTRSALYPADEEIPTDKIVTLSWQEFVFETDKKDRIRINRIAYEICVLNELRDRLKCKEVWVENADRFRNPDEDLPVDFEEKREQYYQQIFQPMDSNIFISKVRNTLEKALESLNENIPNNKYVEIRKHKKKNIKLSPLEAQPEPKNLVLLKKEISKRWKTVSLLDVLKEADLQINFSSHFKSISQREALDPEVLRKRILLNIFAMGTNAGLKRIVAGNHDEKYSDLVYIQKRFMHKECFREAISSIVNHIFSIREPDIWGNATTACASDSKQFGSWDQNLLTEWHNRYGGRGVMIYWHVERKASCIYSQLKSCSSSEVAAMIEGVMRHCTQMKVEKQYVDTHGQSIVAFAFCHLLGFKLMPRFKSIANKKLYQASSGKSHLYPNLKLILNPTIKWDLMTLQYDQMIKFAIAIFTETAQTESILRRFTRESPKHPTYQALEELGKALSTIFLCDYLRLEKIRREIQEALNIIELWNRVNDFILFGKRGEFASNRKRSQELTMLSLHLLQNCLVYINTLMLQEVLADPAIMGIMTPEDFRGLNPLFFNHINPYGTFNLNMKTRIPIKQFAMENI